MKRKGINTTHIILASFLAVILLGSLLLYLPVSAAEGVRVSYTDALFTATTSTCVTGLVTLPTFSTWSPFGQAVILVLIQVGGLGVITVMAGLMLLLNRRMGLGDRLLLQDSFNLNSMSGLVRFVKRVVKGTFIIEGVGALLYMTVFVPQFGARGVWISVFTAVSAFCNAGIDLLGTNSLADYAFNPVVNTVTVLLIVLGGLGYIVWWDVVRVVKLRRRQGRKMFGSLTLHSKIAIVATLALIIGGAVLVFAFEKDNPATMANCTVWQKIQLSLFQSVTTRTAGFFTVAQENLRVPTATLCLVLMFIGGSPVGTAGGVKTVTFAVLIMTAVASLRGKDGIELFGRRLKPQAVNKAVAVTCMSFFIMLASTVALSAVCGGDALDILYETVSATATVGLTRGITPLLNTAGKLIITVTMYLGRVGPISLASAFVLKREGEQLIQNPTEEISVG
ncbi:MAG: potassium transporter KtrB [Ruminococcaceae bacterium]|nr:potassium transporter KtrB [Oscillospiraceae bacterium]